MERHNSLTGRERTAMRMAIDASKCARANPVRPRHNYRLISGLMSASVVTGNSGG